MPAPMRAYAQAAQRFGGVDPSDMVAVRRFFVVEFQDLPEKTKCAIRASLLASDGMPPDDD